MTEKPNEETEKKENKNIEEKNKSNKEKCNFCEVVKSLFSDTAFILALIIIISFGAISASVLNQIEIFKTVSSIWGAWVGAVIGYFFGSRPVEGLTRRVEEALESKDSFRQQMDSLLREMDIIEDKSEKEIDEIYDDFDKLEEKYKKAISDIQFIVARHHTILDKDYLETLKKEYGIRI